MVMLAERWRHLLLLWRAEVRKREADAADMRVGWRDALFFFWFVGVSILDWAVLI